MSCPLHERQDPCIVGEHLRSEARTPTDNSCSSAVPSPTPRQSSATVMARSASSGVDLLRMKRATPTMSEDPSGTATSASWSVWSTSVKKRATRLVRDGVPVWNRWKQRARSTGQRLPAAPLRRRAGWRGRDVAPAPQLQTCCDVFLFVSVEATTTSTAATRIATTHLVQSTPEVLPSPPKAA